MKGQSIGPTDDGGIEITVTVDGTERTLRFREDDSGELAITLVQPDGTEVDYGGWVMRNRISKETKKQIQDARSNGNVQEQLDHILDVLDVIDLN